MTKPTCATCVFFEKATAPHAQGDGLCNHRPIPVPKSSKSFCGLHPAMPAYIASTKPRPEAD